MTSILNPDAPVQPKSNDIVHRITHFRILPFQIGLLRGEQVEIILLVVSSHSQALPWNAAAQLFGSWRLPSASYLAGR
ncbi:hypothetical protein L207DRAFT_509390 [Hyaloscypha variabilis F]|uniref:Uncharacterized protein n=1 Tax=Hyaloscypha variabilis (strain UAMH 11265 / GT02V1 / F) TaxID=1149755 RepID=A0A2J6S1S2_HYAVF|nr:hypothetical protein L207DRAFT_509390 [Hyaloscypha variabilis F]